MRAHINCTQILLLLSFAYYSTFLSLSLIFSFTLNRPPLAVPPWWWPKLSPLPSWYSHIHHIVPSLESIPILAGLFGGDMVEWVVLLLLVVVGRWGFRLRVWVEIKSWVLVEIGLCLWSGSVNAFLFVVGSGLCLGWWLGSGCRRRWVWVCVYG